MPRQIRLVEQNQPKDALAVPRDRDKKRRRWQLLIVLCAGLVYTSGPSAVALLLHGRLTSVEGSTGSVEVTGFAASLVNPLMYLFVLICAAVVLWNAGRILKRDARPLIPIMLGLLVFFALRYFQAGQVLGSLIVLTALSTAIWSIGLYLEDLAILGGLGVSIAVFSLGMSVFSPLAWQNDIEKSLFDSSVVLAGPFSHMNVLGMTLVGLFPFTGLFRNKVLTVLGGFTILACIVLSSSRSSEIAFTIGLFCTVLMLMLTTQSVRRAIFSLMTLIILVVIIWLPFATTDPRIFTNRGAIWMGAAKYFKDSWLIGHYNVFGFRGVLINDIGSLVSHGHNLAIHYLAMTGLLGFCAILLIISPAFANARKLAVTTFVPIVTVVTLLALGVSELPMRTDSFDGAAWSTWGALLCVALLNPSSNQGSIPSEGISKSGPSRRERRLVS